uniref:Uncharacterized protein n=1 Tax=Anopheles culicifacies TaxID=139723 RepID=A0A182MG77_9DIPT
MPKHTHWIAKFPKIDKHQLKEVLKEGSSRTKYGPQCSIPPSSTKPIERLRLSFARNVLNRSLSSIAFVSTRLPSDLSLLGLPPTHVNGNRGWVPAVDYVVLRAAFRSPDHGHRPLGTIWIGFAFVRFGHNVLQAFASVHSLQFCGWVGHTVPIIVFIIFNIIVAVVVVVVVVDVKSIASVCATKSATTPPPPIDEDHRNAATLCVVKEVDGYE